MQYPATGSVITPDGTVYTVTTHAPLSYTFYAHNRELAHTSDIDLHAEFGEDPIAWAQHIDEAMEEAGVIAYSELLECWCPAECLEDWEAEAEQEARWEADHIRQESRSDLFI